MNQLVQIRGASSRETFWFLRTCNAVAGQIGYIHRTAKLLQSAASKHLNGQKPIRRAFPCILLQFYHHFDPIYESMTELTRLERRQ